MALQLAIAFFLPCMLTLLGTPLVRAWANTHGVVDVPDPRRVHRRLTPRLGGLAIVLAFFAALLALDGYFAAAGLMLNVQSGQGLLLGGVLLALVGAVDDVRALGPWPKLIAQIVAASIAFQLGYRIDAISVPSLGELATGPLSYLLTLCWFLSITNAINLIDGLDGLAAGLALLACVSLAVIAGTSGAWDAALASTCLAGALAGFLRYNFAPASVFMGDSGSMFVGFALAAISLRSSIAGDTSTLAILPPLVALGIPLLDTAFAIVRRSWAGRSIFAADREHLHHRLLVAGWSERAAVLTLYAGAAALGLAAIVVAFGRPWQVLTALAFAVSYSAVLLWASRPPALTTIREPQAECASRTR